MKVAREEPLVLCLKILTRMMIRGKSSDTKEEEEEDDDVERLRRIMCVPSDDVVMEQNQMREEESTSIAKGVKRKRGHTSAMFARRCFDVHPIWPDTSVRTRARNRMSVMCARRVFVKLKFENAHAYSHERETVRM